MTRPRSPHAYRTHDAKRLAAYLRAESERANGALHVDGDRLADSLERPPAEIERRLRELSGTVPGLRISREPAPRPLWRVSRP